MPRGNGATSRYRLTYPKSFSGTTPVIIVSHGGSGDKNGHRSLEYLRLENTPPAATWC